MNFETGEEATRVQREWRDLLKYMAASEGDPHSADVAWQEALRWVLLNTFGEGDARRLLFDMRFKVTLDATVSAIMMLRHPERTLRNMDRPKDYINELLMKGFDEEGLRKLLDNGDPR